MQGSRFPSVAALALLVAAPAFAADPAPATAQPEAARGCDSYRWSIERPKALLAATDKPVLASGGMVADPKKAVTVNLVPLDQAKLPMPPERPSKVTPSNAAALQYAAPAREGRYEVTLTDGAWVDLIQNGQYLKPQAFAGAPACDGAKKSMRFQLAKAPYTVQVSGTDKGSIGLVVTAAGR